MDSGDSDILFDPWLRRIGGVWATVMQAHGVPRGGVVVEGAPGGLPKIGLALARLQFQGTIHLVDASPVVSTHVAQRYRRLLPSATVCVVEAKLALALSRLPSSCDALVLNHALDDLILGHALGGGEFAEIFDSCSSDPDCVDRVRSCWQRAETSGDVLSICIEDTHDELGDLIAHCRPHFIGIGEYKSWIHEAFGLEAPDRYARLLAHRLKVSLPCWGYEPSRQCDTTLATQGYDPNRWLLYCRIPGAGVREVAGPPRLRPG